MVFLAGMGSGKKDLEKRGVVGKSDERSRVGVELFEGYSTNEIEIEGKKE